MGKLDSTSEKQIAALVPCYHESMGNATEIIYLDGDSAVIPRTVKTVLRNIAAEFTVDLDASRKKYGEMLGCRRAVPVPLSAGMIMFPLKMRKAVSKNDSSRGYINFAAVKEVREAGRACSMVILENDRQLKCLHSIKNLNQHLRNCHFLYQKLQGSRGTGESAAQYLDCPATKADIAMLLKEIRELRENL